MKQYPSINKYRNTPSQNILAFDKLDGSNIRFEWSRDRGWHKVGTRKCMLDKSHPHLGEAPEIFNEKYSEAIEKVFKDNINYKKHTQFIAFCEFFGPNSFAGVHLENDPKDLVLFDIWIVKKGMIGPREFVKNFGHLEIPHIIYEGKLNTEFIESVRHNVYGLKEGVVCKWGKTGMWRKDINMCKIKTNQYIQKLKDRFGVGKIYKDNAGDFHNVNDDIQK